jgi:hypothetical protein
VGSSRPETNFAPESSYGIELAEALQERGIVTELAASNRVTQWTYAVSALAWVRVDEMVLLSAGGRGCWPLPGR